MSNIFNDKPYFKKIYSEIYSKIIKEMNVIFSSKNKVLEIGSGSHGFIKEIDKWIITSDIIKTKNCDYIINAEKLPFEDGELSVIIGIHVLHHIVNVKSFFNEAVRALEVGGGIILLEPSWGLISSFLHSKFHKEIFNKNESFIEALSNNYANQALSYILFKKYKKEFFNSFNGLEIVSIKPISFLEYIASGGFRPKSYVPPKLLPVLRGIDNLLLPFMRTLSIHQIIIIKKRNQND